MKLRRAINAIIGWRSLILASILITNTGAKKDAPSLSFKTFDHELENIEYFDDSDVIIFQDWDSSTLWRTENAGETWSQVEGIPNNEAWSMYMHPFDKKRAYYLTKEGKHFKTEDRGETWQSFFTEYPPSAYRNPPLSFHADDPNKIIFNAEDCMGIFCEELAMYTTDGFSTDAKVLRGDTAGCYWAKSTAIFTTGNPDLDADRILCSAKGEYSDWLEDYRLLISDYYFDSNAEDDGGFEPDLEPGRTVRGVANMAVVQKYIVAAASSKNTDEMALYVTDDTLKWHRAIFPHDHKLKEKAYTVLESTNYSIQLDVMSGSRALNPMGVLLSSNSNGTYFTRNIEHTNRNIQGYVDFENMSGVQGIIFVNTVDNWEEVRDTILADKQVVSWISFDDGRNWGQLNAGGERLHVHSVTDMSNSGRIFSSPAPGLVMAVGNTGEYLKDYMEGDLYVSDDAGLTWGSRLKGPHKYEFGGQGSILVAIAEGPTDVIRYSLDHGNKWKSTELPVKKFQAQILTTTADSTSLKFLLVGGEPNEDGKLKFQAISINFNDMHERECNQDDLEQWYARVDSDGEATCLMGHKQYYMRRKKDADCFVNQEFKDPEVEIEPCPCTDADFECDFNYVRNTDLEDCKRIGDLIVPEGECKSVGEDATFLGSSGWRLIPGNDCKREDGPQKDDPVSLKCSEAVGPPASKEITNTQTPFSGSSFIEKIYLERTDSSSGDDESIVARTNNNHIFLSRDHGKTWDEILKDVRVKFIIPHSFFNDVIYFVCDNMEVYYSVDRGDNIRKFGRDAPTYPDEDHWPVMNFHPKHKDWIIWVGVKDKSCVGKSDGKSDCHAVASLTEDRGDLWKTLERYVRKCEFVPDVIGQRRADKLIYCDVKKKESSSDVDNPWQLVSSEEFFEDEPTIHFPDVIDFATMSEFIVVATKDEETYMKAEASVDGSHFAEALFPAALKVPHQSSYTVLDSSTHSVFLLVTVEPQKEYKYGTLIKSNSNGTSYVLSLNAVNQDSLGYVDMEKALGIEGVAMANTVANYDTIKKDQVKKLKTKITHNDGADWDFLPPPEEDLDGNVFSCTSATEKCSLHIHGYTERKYKSHTYSSSSAVGLMLGIGNVGEYLGSRDEADTFISTDAGNTWKHARKGAYMWEYGDQGSIIVLVKEREETNIIYYSRNEGANWHKHEFSEEPLLIDEITTVPSDNSRNFVLWAKTSDGLATINIDFTGLTDRPCTLDENDDSKGDYYLWTPKHPKQDDDCLFGHVSQYHRKRTDADCYNGRIIKRLHNIERNCSCTRQDFECDYNYFRSSEGTCSLVGGTVPSSHLEKCAANPEMIEYYDVSGYRRIPLTTCQGGKEMDKLGDPLPCPNHEDEYNKKHGISGVAIFFAIMIPIVVAISAGWWVWRNWEGKFGQIRLGESSTFDGQAPYIKYPVLVISAIVAVIITLPTLASSAWHGISGLLGRGRTARFTTRSSFARGADYAPVDEDEGELLGDDSDEEV